MPVAALEESLKVLDDLRGNKNTKQKNF